MTTFKSIDWLRGMAAIIVCWTHILFKADVLVKDKPYLLPYLDALRPSGSPWVNMFFIISGFVIPYSMHHHGYKLSSFKAFIIKRLVRIEPNYLLSIAFILGMSALMALATNTVYKIDWYNVLLQVGYLNVFFQQKWINDVCWTLGIEFQYYVFIALLFTFIVHPKHFVRLITFGGILLAGVGLGMKTTSAFLFDHIPALLIGVSLFLEKIGLISKKVLVFRILLLIPLVLWLYPESNVWFLFFTALMIYFDIDIRWKPLYFLGKISYSLYLYHQPVGNLLLAYLLIHNLTNLAEYQLVICIVLAISICVIFSNYMYKWVEKPTMLLSKKIKY